MSETITRPVSFSFKGERPYINIATMFEGLLGPLGELAKAAGAPHAMLRLGMMKAVRELAGNGVLTLTSGAKGPPEVERAVLAVSGTLGALPFGAVLAADPAAHPAARVPGGREREVVADIAPSGRFRGAGTLVDLSSPADLVLGFIEVNKQLHQATLKDEAGAPAIRFGYLSGFQTPLEADFSGLRVPLEVVHIGAQESAGRVHTLNRITLDLPGGGQSFTLCFNYYFGDAEPARPAT